MPLRDGASSGQRHAAYLCASFRITTSRRSATLIGQDRRSRRRPVVVADGFCPTCGDQRRWPNFCDAWRRYGGHVVLDDTQALGVFGEQVGALYGRGGGGSLRWQGVKSPDVIVGSSLAKGIRRRRWRCLPAAPT